MLFTDVSRLQDVSDVKDVSRLQDVSDVRQMFQDVAEVCKVLVDSFAGVLLHQYVFVPLNFYMVFCDIPRFLINSSGRILYHQYILIFINFINFINFTSVSSGNV